MHLYINLKLVPLNVVVVGTTIYAAILIGIGFYRPRYRNHHAFVCLLFYGANTLFLPILSYLISIDASLNSDLDKFTRRDIAYVTHYNIGRSLMTVLLLIWACLIQLVQTVGISNAATVAADDREAGRNTGLPVAPLLQATWAAYLVLISNRNEGSYFPTGLDELNLLLLGAFALMFARLLFKCFAFLMAQRSLALRLNPRLIVGYIEQLSLLRAADDDHHVQEELAADTSSHQQIDGEPTSPPPPKLIVMGEETEQVHEQPHGFYLKRLMISQQEQASHTRTCSSMNNNHLETSKDLCLSFALFKMLRCRFAGYTADETGYARAHDFIWQLLRTSHDHRLLGVITNELSFLHDFYFSSVPISYSKRCLPILSLLISLFTICYCLLLVGIWVTYSNEITIWGQVQIMIACYDRSTITDDTLAGSLFYDVVPIFALLALVMLAEARQVASCICSNWAKVALICCQLNINKQLLPYPTRLQKCLVSAVLRFRCNLLNPLDDKMRQLPFHSRKHINIAALLIRPLHHLLIGKTKNVKVPTAVKAAIVNALRSNNGQLSNGVGFLQDHGGRDFIWACTDGEATSDVILTWHIATSILEAKLHHHHPLSSSSSSSDNQIIVATHLSRYCAYLVNCWPELLPDDDKWSKSLYDAVTKDSEHGVVKKGERLGRQLTELKGEEAWSLLAGVWSEMILYVAPSDNLSAHSDAVARGGELITVVWALLMHLGIYKRPRTRPAADANPV